MRRWFRYSIHMIIATGTIVVACEGRETSDGYEVSTTGASSTPHSGPTSATVNKTAATATKPKNSKAESEKEAKQELREVKAREIGVLKNDLDEKRQEISSKKNIMFSLMNQKNQIDGAEIDAHNNSQNPTAGMVGTVSSSGVPIPSSQNYGQPGYYGTGSSGSGQNWVGPVLSGVGVVAAAASDISNEKNQQAAVNASRQKIIRRIAEVQAEIAQLEAELAEIESQLDRLIDPNDLVND